MSTQIIERTLTEKLRDAQAQARRAIDYNISELAKPMNGTARDFDHLRECIRAQQTFDAVTRLIEQYGEVEETT